MTQLLLGAALGATGAFILDPQQGQHRRLQMQGIIGSASVLYALVRGGIGAVVPLALGAALLACAASATPRARSRRA